MSILDGAQQKKEEHDNRTTVAICVLLSSVVAQAGTTIKQDVPWWKKQKIVFMWGKWPYTREDKSQNYYYADLPRDLFRNVAIAGATVFADCVTGTDWAQNDGVLVPSIGRARRHARYAHEFDLKYFNTLVRGPSSSLASDAEKTPGARMPIRGHGTPSGRCPLDESIYNRWIVDPHLELLSEGLLDGIHVGWERSGEVATGGREGFCYCDDCFSKFLEIRGVNSDLPKTAKRFAWVKERELMAAYEKDFRQRRVEMFTRIRERLHAIKPDLMFSSYGMGLQMGQSDFMRAMNTPETPFIFLDHARNYGNDDRQTWWISSNAQLQNQGFLYLPGGWTNPLFDAQASQIDATRWIYEAAVNEDGVWLWF